MVDDEIRLITDEFSDETMAWAFIKDAFSDDRIETSRRVSQGRRGDRRSFYRDEIIEEHLGTDRRNYHIEQHHINAGLGAIFLFSEIQGLSLFLHLASTRATIAPQRTRTRFPLGQRTTGAWWVYLTPGEYFIDDFASNFEVQVSVFPGEMTILHWDPAWIAPPTERIDRVQTATTDDEIAEAIVADRMTLLNHKYGIASDDAREGDFDPYDVLSSRGTGALVIIAPGLVNEWFTLERFIRGRFHHEKGEQTRVFSFSHGGVHAAYFIDLGPGSYRYQSKRYSDDDDWVEFELDEGEIIAERFE